MFEFECDKCGKVLQARDKHAGKLANCDGCGAGIIIPKGGRPVATPEPLSAATRLKNWAKASFNQPKSTAQSVALSPSAQPPPSIPEAHAAYEDASLRAIVFVMASGAEITVNAISLWPKDLLDKAISLLSQAGQNAQGYSSGLGVIGSFGDVMSKTAWIELAEGYISRKMRAGVVPLQQQVLRTIEAAAQQSWLAPVKNIVNVEDMSPDIWTATLQWPNGDTRAFVYNGRAAINVATGDGSTRRLVLRAVEQVYSVRG